MGLADPRGTRVGGVGGMGVQRLSGLNSNLSLSLTMLRVPSSTPMVGCAWGSMSFGVLLVTSLEPPKPGLSWEP